jgi:hypothetical protein
MAAVLVQRSWLSSQSAAEKRGRSTAGRLPDAHSTRHPSLLLAPRFTSKLQSGMDAASDLLFEAETPLGFRVRVDKARWELIIREKHPAMKGRESDVKSALENPNEVRQSKSDASVLLFYKVEGLKRWVCAVTKRSNEDGFLITAYPTDAIKEGTKIWPK